MTLKKIYQMVIFPRSETLLTLVTCSTGCPDERPPDRPNRKQERQEGTKQQQWGLEKHRLWKKGICMGHWPVKGAHFASPTPLSPLILSLARQVLAGFIGEQGEFESNIDS